jgi:hypothetical protein
LTNRTFLIVAATLLIGVPTIIYILYELSDEKPVIDTRKNKKNVVYKPA